MAIANEKIYLSDLLTYELRQHQSREQVTIGSGDIVALGQVVAKVTETGKVVPLSFENEDGSQNAYGIMVDACDASGGDKKGVAIVQDAQIVADYLAWPEGATEEQKAAAFRQLEAKGIAFREEG
jgi:hypothetical protein